MSGVRSKASVAVLLVGAGCGAALGQQILTQKVLSLDLATRVAQAAIDKCRADGFHVTVTVVDAAGLVKVTLRGDGTSPQTIDVSRRKAFTAMVYRRNSSDVVKSFTPWPGVEGTIALAGGVPIFAGQEIVGGLGVSGARSDEEEACGKAATDKFASLLK